ncbi:hypothetical protein [Bacillus sp. OTU530]|jgi:hypothetical protein
MTRIDSKINEEKLGLLTSRRPVFYTVFTRSVHIKIKILNLQKRYATP